MTKIKVWAPYYEAQHRLLVFITFEEMWHLKEMTWNHTSIKNTGIFSSLEPLGHISFRLLKRQFQLTQLEQF